MANLKMHSLPINLGTPYLTNESAYFLGGIIAANETVSISNTECWVSPVRYNYEYLTEAELRSHYTSVNAIANVLNNKTYYVDGSYININGFTLKVNKFTGRHSGFVTLFPKKEKINVEELASLTEEVLKTSSEEVIRCFITGIFDGRGAIDFDTYKKSIRYIALDCANIQVATIFTSILNNFITNYNTSRDRLEGGIRRDNQFRIKDINYYYRSIGYISDVRFNKYLEGNPRVTTNYEDTILTGLKTIS
ncbi:hypothetical protein [Paenibacillus amylolyticus]|uniref:hypothetical protein n=1 Tax=Paenibacillus amylolyticus TaxID=1451 RepID=UPI0039B0178A